MDHLREYLNTLNPAEPLYLGYRLAPFMVGWLQERTELTEKLFSFQNNGYNSGGSGYILSNAAMRMFVEQLYHNVRLCPYDRGEDRGMGRCLESVGITPSDTRDDQELNRFMPFRPAEIPIIGSKWHYFPLKVGWYGPKPSNNYFSVSIHIEKVCDTSSSSSGNDDIPRQITLFRKRRTNI